MRLKFCDTIGVDVYVVLILLLLWGVVFVLKWFVVFEELQKKQLGHRYYVRK